MITQGKRLKARRPGFIIKEISSPVTAAELSAVKHTNDTNDTKAFQPQMNAKGAKAFNHG